MRSSPTAVRFLLLLLCSNTRMHPPAHAGTLVELSALLSKGSQCAWVSSRVPQVLAVPPALPEMGPARPGFKGSRSLLVFGGEAGE